MYVGSDLVYSMHHGSKAAAVANSLKPADGLAYFFSYVDDTEYDASQLPSLEWRPLEGKFFSDFDFNYSNSCINTTSSHSNSVSKVKKSRKLVAEHGSSSGTSSTFADRESGVFNRTFPAHVKDFSIGDRVDAMDHKCMWYSSTVVDVYDIAMVDIRKYGYKKYPRKVPADRLNSKYSKSKSKYLPQDTSKPVYVTSGYSVRIHFDNFSSNWDEWFDQNDFENGCIAPIYSKSQRKVKILNFHVIQRVLAPLIFEEDDLSDNEEEDMTNIQSKYSVPSVKNSLTSNQKPLPPKKSQSSKESRASKSAFSLNSSHSNRDNVVDSRASEREGSNAAGSAQDGSSKTEYRIEVLDSPLLIQCESYRSTQHLYNIISEQIVRYYTAGNNFND